MSQNIRGAKHRGSWYESSASKLDKQLSDWLGFKNTQNDSNILKAVISPHAGYAYSGSTAGYAYYNINPSNYNKIFILGPSHHVRLNTCALSPALYYETPFYNLKIDEEIYAELQATGLFKTFTLDQDEDEHSLEMQLPYLAKVMSNYKDQFTIIPIIVGSLSYEKEAQFGQLLAKYFLRPNVLFVISSDFCHWGRRFNYMYHDKSFEIYESIQNLDKRGMYLIENLDPEGFYRYLKECGNTICGRHPIAILLQIYKNIAGQVQDRKIRFLDYKQSNRAQTYNDSSVSYAAAICTIKL